MYHITRLPNGLRLATAELPHMASVSLGIWSAVGSRCERAGETGISHFLEHMLFKGTPLRSAARISQEVEGLGGYINACTSEESTCYHARAHAGQAAKLMDVLADMYLNPVFDRQEITRERRVIKEEIAMTLDQPSQHVLELSDESLWPGQPLGRSIAGDERTLNRTRRRELAGFHARHYVSGSTVVVAAGDIRHRDLLDLAKRLAGRIPTGKRSSWFPAVNGQARPEIKLFTRDMEQTQFALGIRTCSRHDPRRFALRLANVILGENMSSRLFQSIREEHGLAYSIYSTPNFYHDTGSLTIAAGLDTAHTQKALKLTLDELRRLRDKPPGARELRRARDYLIGQLELSLESTESQMNWVGEQLLGFDQIIPPDEIKARLNEIRPGDIRRVASDFFRPERLCLSLVSPLKSNRGLRKLIEL
ncbi:MAG: pitrilysin family protein [Verrucomicrobiota bacterium]|nr:pitrilysin family protein [Verrucomicrobiota bacterium]|tara:strand:- start:2586 stop:3848 length:1263 start_codon:yes stop_codon:yes gene_type:complete